MGDGLPTTIALAFPFALALGAAGRHAYVSHTRRRLLRAAAGAAVEMRVLAGVAARAAARRHEPRILPEHLLLAATLDHQVTDALAARGTDAAALRAALAWEMADATPDGEDDPGRWLAPSASAAATLVAAAARARAAGRELSPIHLVSALVETARGSWAARVLAAFGVDGDLGPAADDRDGGPHDRAAPPYRQRDLPATAGVRLHDDAAQRLERMAQLLCDCFDKDEAEADHLVLTACHGGSALVGVYPLDEVTRLVDQATAAATAQEMALHLTVEPAAPRRARAGLGIETSATQAVAFARAQARAARHREVTVVHLLHALLCGEWLAARVTAAGGDPLAILEALEDHLTPAVAFPGAPALAAEVEDLLTGAIVAAVAAGQPDLEDTDLLAAVLDAGGPPWLRAMLAAQGVTRASVERAAVAGPPGDAVSAGEARVVLHNDDVTKMEMVVSILMEVFDKTEPAARDLMLRVHHSGSAVAGVYAQQIAEAKVAAALAMAREDDAPLRITLEGGASPDPPAP